MKSFKNFLYDKNDIVLAVIILIIAALLIVWRLNVIMDYPKTLAKETGTQTTTEDSAVGAGDQSDSQDSNPTSLWADGMLTKDLTITIPGGSASGAAQALIDAGLFKSYDEFSQVCKASGHSAESIKASKFTFAKGSTQTDIAKLVTN